MNKVLIKLYVPMIEQQFDVFIPLNKKIYKIILLLVKVVSEFSGGYYKPKKMPLIYDKITAIPFDVNLTVKESNIKNGTELILL